MSSTQKTDAETPTGDNWRVAAIPGVGDFRARCLIAGIETAEACDRAADGERKLLARSGVLDALAARRRKIRETTKGA